MTEIEKLDRIAIDVRSRKLLNQLLDENPEFDIILRNSKNETEVVVGVREWIERTLKDREDAFRFYHARHSGAELFDRLEWRDYAIIRILDYIDQAGIEYPDLNLRGEIAVSNPLRLIWLAVHKGTGGARPDFFFDMIMLFRQLRGESEQPVYLPERVSGWMDRYPSGLDPRIVRLREENKQRIIRILMEQIDGGEVKSQRYFFEPGLDQSGKLKKMEEWWQDYRFHLRFAVRSPELLNKMLDHSLDPDTMKILKDAEKAGIPFFVNPYYLSLLHVRVPYFAVGADLAIRYYVLYSKQLVEEFGNIVAWEKEDQVEPGLPNAAGWLLPEGHNIHRRYPEVAILIPDTMGRACAGLCSSCQRMYDFQGGRLNFDLDKLAPGEKWGEKLKKLMTYFEKDAQLRDILITGGDGLMSSDKSIRLLLDEIYEMSLRKIARNKSLPDGQKLAELVRIRIGTRLPVYLPQRITPKLVNILKEFKEKASEAGIKQFLIQTHFMSPMEVSPESGKAVRRLISAGWTVTNQLVFTAAASRRGHSAKLRMVLNDIGVLPYYTFAVKGYMENNAGFTPNARIVQEQLEEKVAGKIAQEHYDTIRKFPEETSMMVENIQALRKFTGLPFLATDRNVLNLPGVGKSMTFRVVGITRYGRRILEFDHDSTRRHSPIIKKMGKVIIIESKSIHEYLRQLEDLGEDREDYKGLYGYSLGQTEQRHPVYEYPEYAGQITEEMTNLQI
ncbi:MAG: KamA family protein [Bacteroidetes bacterium]|nr:MAG: KamA family protein [Bacteroidota bacterium]RLD93455.1 MAG: KamA family protein [Bacteroidota bacterium]